MCWTWSAQPVARQIEMSRLTASISASGGITKRGAGVLYLAATNTFGGSVTVKMPRGTVSQALEPVRS